jgi:hypothetical protein
VQASTSEIIIAAKCPASKKQPLSLKPSSPASRPFEFFFQFFTDYEDEAKSRSEGSESVHYESGIKNTSTRSGMTRGDDPKAEKTQITVAWSGR